MPLQMLFDNDIFLETDYPVAETSMDRMNPEGSGCVNDYTDGTLFARDIAEQFPEHRSLIDLGTSTGTVPLTMRRVGILAVGLEGSESPRERGLGCWSQMPEIVRTCDIGKPFRVLDADGASVMFDLVTAWDVLEHIPETNIEQFLANIANLMGPDSLAILEFSVAYNPADGYHQLWENWENRSFEARSAWVRKLTSRYFVIDPALTVLRDWHYCRPNIYERQYSRDNGLDEFPISRPLWWLRKK